MTGAASDGTALNDKLNSHVYNDFRKLTRETTQPAHGHDMLKT